MLPTQTSAILHGRRQNAPVQLRAKLVIAADGSGSRLAQKARERYEHSSFSDDHEPPITLPWDNRARFTAMRGYFSGIKGLDDVLEFYFFTSVERPTTGYFRLAMGVQMWG